MIPLTIFDIGTIRSYRPCYDPSRYLPEDWKGTALDILQHPAIPANDKLWVVCREHLLSERTLRLFAVRCARDALALIPNPDPRSISACDVAERFANGEATAEELFDAWHDAAPVAFRTAAWSVACFIAIPIRHEDDSAEVENLINMIQDHYGLRSAPTSTRGRDALMALVLPLPDDWKELEKSEPLLFAEELKDYEDQLTAVLHEWCLEHAQYEKDQSRDAQLPDDLTVEHANLILAQQEFDMTVIGIVSTDDWIYEQMKNGWEQAVSALQHGFTVRDSGAAWRPN